LVKLYTCFQTPGKVSAAYSVFTYCINIKKMQVYGVLTYLLINAYSSNSFESQTSSSRQFIETQSETGNKFIGIEDILFAQKEDRKYYLRTDREKHRTKYTITELSKLLPSDQFIRINRATIVNISSIKGYSYWENDKYVLTLKSGDEFSMTRKRLNSVKNSLKLLQL
jgi:DNA-binding LytR/AlgR family response regulator